MMPYPISVEQAGPMPELNNYMTVQEAAEALDVHSTTINKMIAKGKLEYIKAGYATLILRRSVADYKKATAGMSKNDPRRGRQK